MAKRLAVIIRDRQSEAFRMSIGLTILEDRVDIFLTKPLLNDTETAMQLEGATEVGIPILSTVPEESRFPSISMEEMAQSLLKADHIIVY